MVPRSRPAKVRLLSDVVQELALRDPHWLKQWRIVLEWHLKELNQGGIFRKVEDHAS